MLKGLICKKWCILKDVSRRVEVLKGLWGNLGERRKVRRRRLVWEENNKMDIQELGGRGL